MPELICWNCRSTQPDIPNDIPEAQKQAMMRCVKCGAMCETERRSDAPVRN